MSGGSVVRIDSADGRTRGWQACVYVQHPRYVSKLFSDGQHGGQAKAYQAAIEALPSLKRKAKRAQR